MNIARQLFPRTALFTLASSPSISGYGFWKMAAWAPALWPLPDGPLSYLFISSMLLVEEAAMELNAIRGGLQGVIQEWYPFEAI